MAVLPITIAPDEWSKSIISAFWEYDLPFLITVPHSVGMSTVPEVLVANHCDLPVIAISVITNLAAGMNKTKLSHKETLENASLAEQNIVQLIKNFITEVKFNDSTGNN